MTFHTKVLQGHFTQINAKTLQMLRNNHTKPLLIDVLHEHWLTQLAINFNDDDDDNGDNT